MAGRVNSLDWLNTLDLLDALQPGDIPLSRFTMARYS